MARQTGYRFENGKSALINPYTGDHTLTGADNGAIVVITSGSAKTLTVPQYLPVGFNCLIVQGGAGVITVSPSSTTVNNVDSFTDTAGQGAVAALASYDVDTFTLAGQLG